MSTCRGCWGDELGTVPGVVLTSVIGDDPLVAHQPSGAVTQRCQIGQPHRMSECGEFDPVRPGFESAPSLPRGPFLRQMSTGDWDRYFALLSDVDNSRQRMTTEAST